NVKIGLYDDVDLGNYLDDYMGCHVSSNLGFSYNADGVDENTSGLIGYGNYPPATGKCFLKGPPAPPNDGLDNDNDGMIDELNEESLLDEFVYYNPNINPNPTPTHPPTGPYEFFNYMNARWRDSSYYTCGGNGYGGTTPTRFLYPWTFYNGMPCSIWSDNVNPKGDRRNMMATGAFNLNSKSEVEFEFAKVWSVDSTNANDNIGAVNKLLSDVQKINTFYKSGTQSTCLPNMAIGISENQLTILEVEVYPNPTQEKLQIKLAREEKCEMSIKDVMGKTIFSKRFEGYSTIIDVKDLSQGVYFIHLRQNGA
ncbi:MAG TPA: T9SS type A sorting domain-containing protein, partial [Bacteroidia bacterium]|nr:T9SS type A sorting domain-containing protein [Bacteroidia bacterium]